MAGTLDVPMTTPAASEPVATSIHDHEKAYAILNELLVALRADRKDSVSVAEKLQLIVKEWAKHANLSPSIEEPVLRSGVNGKTVREQMRLNPNTKAIMLLVKHAERNELELVHRMVAKLATKEGRGMLLKEFGGQLDVAPDIDTISNDNVGNDASCALCIPPPQAKVQLANLTHNDSMSLNGANCTITSYDAEIDR